MRTKTMTAMIPALLLMVGLGLVPTVQAADQCDDEEDINNDLYCEFSCEQGETVSVGVSGDGYGWGSAECHSASAGCDGVDICADTGVDDPATSSGDGECRGNMNNADILCTSQSGSGTLIAFILSLIRAGASCEQIQEVVSHSNTSSFVYGHFENGQLVSQMAWNSVDGCT